MTKKYLKFNALVFLVLFLLSYSTISGTSVSADYENIIAHKVYETAWEIINEKFYFRSRINLDKWQNKFENKINNLNDAHKYISKLIKELQDPYTIFLTKEEYKDEENIINSTIVGIGIKLASKKPFVLDILPESPAYKEGIKKNDYILAINDRSTRNLSSSQVANLIRGQKDTILTVKIKRGNETLVKEVKREELKFKPVSSQLLESGIALVKIDSFIPENTSQEFKNEILKLMSAKGLIIDLRNNSGGLLKNAVEIADMFLSEGKIVSTVGQFGRTTEFANSNKLFENGIVILVNENTASASEIVASALKENKRAIVIGKRTYGKGLVQEIVQLPDDSALHVTVSSYLTPNGRDINNIGVIPDEIVFDENEQLKRAKEVLID